MERARKAMKWNQRSEHVKLVILLGIVVGATLGGDVVDTEALSKPAGGYGPKCDHGDWVW